MTSYSVYPADTVNGILYAAGRAGYSSGGTLAGVMGATTTATTGYSVTYLSTGDAGTAITAGAKELTYNGFLYSSTAVTEGQYTFWGYEHLMYRPALAGVKLSVIGTTLNNQLTTTDAAVLLSSMNVSRQVDGSTVGQNY